MKKWFGQRFKQIMLVKLCWTKLKLNRNGKLPFNKMTKTKKKRKLGNVLNFK